MADQVLGFLAEIEQIRYRAFICGFTGFMEPDHSPVAFHADMPIHIQCQD